MGLDHEGWLLGSHVCAVVEDAEHELDDEEDEDDDTDDLVG